MHHSVKIRRVVLAMSLIASIVGGLTFPSADAGAIPTVLSSPEGERRGEVA